MVAVPSVSANELVEVSSNNVVSTPHQTGGTGYKKVTATIYGIPLNCPKQEGFANCMVQARLVHKGTRIYSTWTEHPWQTLMEPKLAWPLTPQTAHGYHTWKIQTRFMYTRTITSKTKVCVYPEVAASISGKIAKMIGKAGGSFGFGASYCYEQSSTQWETSYTGSTDVDQSAGTIYTD